MSTKENLEFAERMNTVADKLGIPAKGKNRQALLGAKFSVSQESARKWLSGDSIPRDAKCIEIATTAKVNYEWLKTGRGEMRANINKVKQEPPPAYAPEKETLQVDNIQDFKKYVDSLDTIGREQLLEIASAFVSLNTTYRKRLRDDANIYYKATTVEYKAKQATNQMEADGITTRTIIGKASGTGQNKKAASS